MIHCGFNRKKQVILNMNFRKTKYTILGLTVILMCGYSFARVGNDESPIQDNVAVYKTSDNNIWVDNNTLLLDNVNKFQVDGNFVVALKNNKELMGKEGKHGTWYSLLGNVDEFYVSKNFIGALVGNVLYGKEGLHGTWYSLLGNVRSFDMYGNTFIAITTDNVLKGKEGLTGIWYDLRADVKKSIICMPIIGALDFNGTLWGKSGLHGTWYQEIDKVKEFNVDRGNIWALMEDNVLLSKTGVCGTWGTVMYNVKTFQTQNVRLENISGPLDGKEGRGYNPFEDVKNYSTTVLTNDNALYIVFGGMSMAIAENVTNFRTMTYSKVGYTSNDCLCIYDAGSHNSTYYGSKGSGVIFEQF